MKDVKKMMCCVCMSAILMAQQVVTATEILENTEIVESTEVVENTENIETEKGVEEVSESTEIIETEIVENTETTEESATEEASEFIEIIETEKEIENKGNIESTEIVENTENATEFSIVCNLIESPIVSEDESVESTEGLEGTELEESKEKLQMFLLSGKEEYTDAGSLNVGDIVNVELYVNDLNITYWEGYLTYNAEIFELDKSVDIILSDTLNGWSVTYDEETALLCIGRENGEISENGFVATLQFHVKKAVSDVVMEEQIVTEPPIVFEDENTEMTEETSTEESTENVENTEMTEETSTEESRENVENTETTEEISTEESTENVENTEMTEETSTEESTENVENTEMTEETSTEENTENVENTEMTEETSTEESIENVENTEMTEETSTEESTENVENTEATEETSTEESTEVVENTEMTEETSTEESTENVENTEATEETSTEESTENVENMETTEETSTEESTEVVENTEMTEEIATEEGTEEPKENLQMFLFSGKAEYTEAYTDASSLNTGDIVDVDLYVNDLNITYWEGYLTYNKEILDLDKNVDIILADTLSGWSASYEEKTGLLCIKRESGEISANGFLATLQFHVKNAASDTIVEINDIYWSAAGDMNNAEQLESVDVSIYSIGLLNNDKLPDTAWEDNRNWYYITFIVSGIVMASTYLMKKRYDKEESC